MNRQGLLSASGLLLLGLIMLMTLHEWEDTLPGQDTAVLEAPAIIATRITARAFHPEDGSRQYLLTADKLTQYDHTAITEMASPTLEMSDEKGRWTITSESGQVREHGDIIAFSGDVLVENNAQQVTLRSDDLHFNTETNTASTPGQVTIQSPSGQTEAGALEAQLDNGILTLNQGVKSEFIAPAS